ncbi:D-alanyl-D-alanine carboxypeptidase DacF precursor [Jannaschia seosinensis]|uniref:D-alanyl-D-alanine carboxypeptidase DacF n=1 Tax=Jannaschia seosinensis TaxID=313367 RepID=A0A0M7B9C1_9RHOB|nr:D-alanyl-D-alanine carboxypeptidase family protein [Jannaschia seosinensis]CUH38201.1 D-alanyl-D-alanine carboxypeptidase DacF precursor [Jannaschia seosinensis]
MTRLRAAFRGLMTIVLTLVATGLFLAAPGFAAPHAEFVMDARTGEVLRADNADSRLHPASTTKMMTLYIAFEAVRLGEITLDTEVRISHNAAATPYAIGFRAGSRIPLRYLLRSAAVRSSNDGATAIAEAISGSVEAFAARMNRTAAALGMTNSTFRNPHGLTQSGHLASARDMSILGRRLFYDYPQYYNLFGRTSTDIGIKTVRSTNRRVLNEYRGADGIKTGFTNAAGFNLVSSADRGGVRIIATVFGGRSSRDRDKRIMELLDLGFARAPARVTERRPELPRYNNATIVGATAPASSMRPVMRGRLGGDLYASASAPSDVAPSSAAVVPTPRPAFEEPAPIVVTRAASGTAVYGIALARQGTRSAADKLLLRAALQELDTLDQALRQVNRVSGGFAPAFVGLSERDALRACTRLRARDVECDVVMGG